MPVERDMPAVVVAIQTERLPQSRVILRVDRGAPGGPPVGTQPRFALDRSAPGRPRSVGASRMYRPEPRRRQGGKHQGVRADRLGNTLAPTSRTGVEQLPHIARVLQRARRAHRRPPVATADQQHPIRLALGRVGHPPTGGGVVFDAPAQSHRV